MNIRQAANGQTIVPDDGPSIQNVSGTINADAAGEAYEIVYNIANPVENGTLTPSCNASWISGLTDAGGKVNFTVAPNSGSERETVITLTYSSAKCSIEPKDPTMPYITMTIATSKMEGYGDEEWFGADMYYFQQMATMFGMNLQDYLDDLRIQRGNLEFEVTGLIPGEEYYHYAYGIDNSTDSPQLTTKITRSTFTTLSPKPIEGEIRLDVTILDNNGTIVATPWDNSLIYYVDWLSESILVDFGYTEGTIEERIADSIVQDKQS